MHLTGYPGKAHLYAKNHQVTEWEVKDNLMFYTEKQTMTSYEVVVNLDTMKESRKQITK